MCGASAKDGANLHIDRIIPISHGGRTVPESLQTLCQSCNLGKSNRFVGLRSVHVRDGLSLGDGPWGGVVSRLECHVEDVVSHRAMVSENCLGIST
jgi:hypothetical protein